MMLQYMEKKEQIERCLGKQALQIGEGAFADALAGAEILGGWSESSLRKYAIYVVARDADPHALVEVGFVEGKGIDELEKELEDRFEIRRGVDSKHSGVFFWLIPATSQEEAYELSCLIWHTYLAQSNVHHPKSPREDLLCPFSPGCEDL